MNDSSSIENHIKLAFQYANSREIDNAIDTFFLVRKMITSSLELRSLGDIQNPSDHLSKNLQGRKNEAISYQYHLNKKSPQNSNKAQNVFFISDSLGLPRPIVSINNSTGIEDTYCCKITPLLNYMGFNVNTHFQRSTTTTEFLRDWDEIVFNPVGSHVFMHLGLCDHVERIFLWDQHVVLNTYPEEIKSLILEFAKRFRTQIIQRQRNHAYVPIEEFKKNLHNIIHYSKLKGVKSLTFVNIIAPLEEECLKSPRARYTHSLYNQVFYELEQTYNINLIDMDRLSWQNGIYKSVISDHHHLSDEGHELIATQILDSFQRRIHL
jgi:hypothetical protein